MYRMFYLILFLICGLSNAGAAEPVSFEEANGLYQAGKYQEAIHAYEELLASGWRSPEIYYNLGNSYYKKEKLGKAVLYYRRALLLAPYDADIQHNLGIVKQQLVDDISPLPRFFLASWWTTLRQLMSSGKWSVLSLLFLWLGIAAVVGWLLGVTRKIKKYSFLGGMVSILLSLLFGSLAYSQASYEQDSRQAVILQKEVAMQSAPDTESTIILLLHEGTSVELLDVIGDWHKVRLENGEQGWLPTNKIEKI